MMGTLDSKLPEVRDFDSFIFRLPEAEKVTHTERWQVNLYHTRYRVCDSVFENFSSNLIYSDPKFMISYFTKLIVSEGLEIKVKILSFNTGNFRNTSYMT